MGGSSDHESNGINYAFQQCHWHSPSEHTINGKREPIEKKDDNGFTFESVLFESLWTLGQRDRERSLAEDEQLFLSFSNEEDMEMDSEMIPQEEMEKNTKGVIVILMGAPGSGKSTFCENVIKAAKRTWVRVCQDTIGNGKSGTKAQCLKSAVEALKDGKSVFIDRCNIDRQQRAEFVKLGGPQVDVHAVVLDLPARLCISRSVKRTGHEGNLQGGKAAAVVNRMLQNKELPKLNEGFSRITFCQNDTDIQGVVNTYTALGPRDTLPLGCFGQKNPGAMVQLGIMKFLKKVENPAKDSNVNCSHGTVSNEETEEPAGKECKETTPSAVQNSNQEIKMDENLPLDSSAAVISETSSSGSTLAFPSISTADFQFNLEKASDVIVEEVENFFNKVENVKLVLVDLTHRSKILALVRAKALQKNIDPAKFLTFVGDITQLYTLGGLRCNVIANAANWRLKPGGGGVNAAIFNAAGPSLEAATEKLAGSLAPGSALVVPLPLTSPLYKKEGVTHVIHVLGPNMNPHRPNFLNNDYNKGCNVLRKAYSSLFEGFASAVNKQITEKGCGEDLPQRQPTSDFSNNNQKIKRGATYDSERNKKCKGLDGEPGNQHVFSESNESVCLSGSTSAKKRNPQLDNDNAGGETPKSWGSWAQGLHHIAIHPEKYSNVVIEMVDDVVVLNDLYPKAQNHLLVLARKDGLDHLADVGEEHLQLLRTMHAVGVKWARKFSSDDASLIFRLGYHSTPSMQQLHLHVISQDFNSTHLKNKKHWNSFTTAFFRDSVDVIDEISKYGKARLNNDEKLLSMELRCHRCRSAHPNIPRLKSHISKCRAPFPPSLLQEGHLIPAPPSGAETEA
ncbi:hypothetical protein IFM89_012274 [Coptis chinensis]|uniref:Transcription factor bHLH140 n=1 Tax=Coptis chinensis TaxID=261450 RepID=A0A835LI80_9MAGN|nr:hypothetical protein IFM89_012274 [Coptis chinensis]